MLKQSLVPLLLILSIAGTVTSQTFAAQTHDKILIAKKEKKTKKATVQWQNDLQQACALAKQEGRENVFAHIGAKWCGPCQFMESKIFPNANVQKFLSDNYVNAAFDADTPAGQELMKKYQMRGIPALFVFDNNGNLKGKFSGAPPNDQVFIQAVTQMTSGQLNSR